MGAPILVTLRKKDSVANLPVYRLSPDLALEYFGDKALILVAMRDRFLTVNKPAAELLELIEATFKEQIFSAKGLSVLLQKHYHLPRTRTQREIRRILTAWSKQGIFIPLNSPA